MPPKSATVACIEMPDGFAMTYRSAGSGAGPPLLICHGLGANHVQFEADIEHFAASRRVIQPDMRGHGDSGLPPNSGVTDFTCLKFAEDIAFLLDHLGIAQVDVLGNSLGGNVALELIALRPGLVRSLATYGCTYKLNVPRWALGVRDLVYFMVGDNLARWAAEQTSKTPHGREVLTRTFSLVRRDVAKWVGPNICRFDYLDTVRAFKGEILLLQCKGDDNINRTLKPTLQALRTLSNAQVRQFKTGGHCANVDDPDGFWAEIDAFLRHVEAKALSAAPS